MHQRGACDGRGLLARAAKHLPLGLDAPGRDTPGGRVLVDEHLSGAAVDRGDPRDAAAIRAILVGTTHAPAGSAVGTIVGVAGCRIARLAHAGLPGWVDTIEHDPSHVASAYAGPVVGQIRRPAARGKAVDRPVRDHAARIVRHRSGAAAVAGVRPRRGTSGVHGRLVDARGVHRRGRRPARIDARPRAAGHDAREQSDRRATHGPIVAPAIQGVP
jgi:hypothetical protein